MNFLSAFSELAPIPVGVTIAAVTYFFTKRREREAEWRKIKLKHYEEFTKSLSSSIQDQSDPELKRAFCRASNNLMLFAPQDVLLSLYEYQDCTRVGYDAPKEEYDAKLKSLMLSIRNDIGVSPSDNIDSFIVRLWAAPSSDV